MKSPSHGAQLRHKEKDSSTHSDIVIDQSQPTENCLARDCTPRGVIHEIRAARPFHAAGASPPARVRTAGGRQRPQQPRPWSRHSHAGVLSRAAQAPWTARL